MEPVCLAGALRACSAAFAGDGEHVYVACAGEPACVREYNASTGASLSCVTFPSAAKFCFLSRDARRVSLVADDGAVRVYTVATQTLVCEISDPALLTEQGAFSHDGTHLFIFNRSKSPYVNTVARVDVSTGKVVQQYGGALLRVCAIALNGGRLVAANEFLNTRVVASLSLY